MDETTANPERRPPTPDCLTTECLDRLAAGEAPSPPEQDHLITCSLCRDAVAAARDDRALMASLARAVAAPTAPLTPPSRPASRTLPPGTRIAEFTITGVLGRGGMGVVYAAEQDAPRRSVALKLVQADLASAEALRRFEHEAAALALLRHPGIAQVYRAGVAGASEPDDGSPGPPRPFIAMELVTGRPLEEFAPADSTPLPTRLRLVAAVCDAADHAHRRGVIHRDLKPSNILVRESPDGTPHPVIVDFGIAKLRADPAASGVTRDGSFVGTLAFAAPEQVGGDPAAMDARADVYALGVVLYRLVTGRHPYSLDGSLADAVRTIAEARITPPRAAAPAISAELALVISTALAADPARRYQSAALLADDLHRYLDRRPLRARGDSAAYVLRKAVARHPYRTAGLALSTLALLAAGATAATLRVQAARAEQAKARVLDAVLSAVERADPDDIDTPRLETIADFLDETGRVVDDHLADYPEEHALVLLRLGRANLGHRRFNDATAQLQRVTDHRRASADRDPDAYAEALIDLGRAHYHRGDFATAFSHFQEALDLRLRTAGPDDPATIRAQYHAGTALLGWKRYDDAEIHLRSVADAQARIAPGSPEHAEYLNALAACFRGAGRFAEALDAAQHALALIERSAGSDAKPVAAAISNVAANLISLNRFAEAEPLLARAMSIRERWYGPGDPRLAATLVQMASLKLRRGTADPRSPDVAVLDDSAAFAARALEIRRRIHAGDHESVAEALSLLGQARMHAGRLHDARAALAEALDMRRRLPRHHDGDLGWSESLLGECLSRAGDHDAAEPLLRSGLARLRDAYGDSHARTTAADASLQRHLDARKHASPPAAAPSPGG